ncbi:MAG TPA: response regulator [Chitinophagaceae bacterium]|nr:response regulator [Chitinophagaceae bacterium]
MNKIFLLADDDNDDMQLFCEALESVDPSVICYCAVNGLEVLDILSREEKPDLIFLDVNMPGMNGWQCLKAIKEIEAYKHIPVFMYSTSAHQREVDIALNLGAMCFFTKPHKFSELKSILQVITENIHANLLSAASQNKHMKCGDRRVMTEQRKSIL